MINDELRDVLDEALIDSVKAADLDERLHERWGRTAAVLVVDMSGYSRRCRDEHIASALLSIRRMELIGKELIELSGGRYVKDWADNLMAVFDTVRAAEEAGRAITALLPSAAGVGYGFILDLGEDLRGCEVNEACILGEDVAKCGEVLLTEAARENRK